MLKFKIMLMVAVFILGMAFPFPSIASVVEADSTIDVPGDFSTIQAAIDAASEGDTIYVHSDTYYEQVNIGNGLTIKGENMSTTIIDGNGSYYAVGVNAMEGVMLQGFTVRNSYFGVFAIDCRNMEISNCIVTNCSHSGIFGDSSHGLKITNCTLNENLRGAYLEYLYGGKITGTKLNGNSIIGLHADRVNNLEIIDCEIHGNPSAATFIGTSHVAVCSTSFKNNGDSIYFSISDDFFFSRCEISNNTDEGLEIVNSDGVVNSCNITNNRIGEFISSSQVKNRFCSISENSENGILNWGGSIDSVDCWWGSVSGPYHYSTNPSGTGNSIDDNVTYIPWQTSLYQPDTSISELWCQAGNIDWRVTYPDQVTPKPLGCGAALTSDWLASAFVTTKLSYITEGLDTDGSFVNQATGRPTGDPGTGILTFGGPFVNPIVKRAENHSTPISDRAPVRFHSETDTFYFQYMNGTNIPNASLPLSVINHDEDLFVIERYIDGDGRLITICYGFGWPGTYAAGKYFDKRVYTNLGEYTYSWLIVHWEDTNMDGFVNNPGEGDAYTVIATGN